MTERRSYSGGAMSVGDRERVVDSIAAAIYVEWNIRNVLVWENARNGTQHWHEDCPAFHRTKHGIAKLIPHEVGVTKPCGTCSTLQRRDNVREANAQRKALLAIQPPQRYAVLDEIHVWDEEAERLFRMAHRALGA